jgi:MFS family permease
MAFGNSLASPAIVSLVSKISHEDEQGTSLGIMQSGASLARAIGPTVGGFLLNNSLNTIDNFTIARTFWTASGIMFVAFLTTIYFLRVVKTEQMVAGI